MWVLNCEVITATLSTHVHTYFIHFNGKLNGYNQCRRGKYLRIRSKTVVLQFYLLNCYQLLLSVSFPSAVVYTCSGIAMFIIVLYFDVVIIVNISFFWLNETRTFITSSVRDTRKTLHYNTFPTKGVVSRYLFSLNFSRTVVSICDEKVVDVCFRRRFLKR